VERVLVLEVTGLEVGDDVRDGAVNAYGAFALYLRSVQVDYRRMRARSLASASSAVGPDPS